MNARQLFDEGLTIGQVAAETETSFTVAAHLCRPVNPSWPTFTPEQLASLPEHVRQMIETMNPNHKRTP